MAFAIKRFADAGVLAAAADRATATTMITSEGRALTEIQLVAAQSSAAVPESRIAAGGDDRVGGPRRDSAKPASGVDGTRIPLMRAGCRPRLVLGVVRLYPRRHPFQRRETCQMALPKMDIPVGLVEWEVLSWSTTRSGRSRQRDRPRRFRIAGVARGGGMFRWTTTGRRALHRRGCCRPRVCCPVKFAAAFSTTRDRRFLARRSVSRSGVIGHRRFPMCAANLRSQACHLAT